MRKIALGMGINIGEDIEPTKQELILARKFINEKRSKLGQELGRGGIFKQEQLGRVYGCLYPLRPEEVVAFMDIVGAERKKRRARDTRRRVVHFLDYLDHQEERNLAVAKFIKTAQVSVAGVRGDEYLTKREKRDQIDQIIKIALKETGNFVPKEFVMAQLKGDKYQPRNDLTRKINSFIQQQSEIVQEKPKGQEKEALNPEELKQTKEALERAKNNQDLLTERVRYWQGEHKKVQATLQEALRKIWVLEHPVAKIKGVANIIPTLRDKSFAIIDRIGKKMDNILGGRLAWQAEYSQPPTIEAKYQILN